MLSISIISPIMSGYTAFIKKKSSLSINKLKTECNKQDAERQNERGKPFILAVRESNITLNGSLIDLQRVFVKVKGASVLCSVGWVLDKNLTMCMQCCRSFSMSKGKHHCRACGDLLCSHCCFRKTFINGAELLGRFLVCTKCFSCATGKANITGSLDWGSKVYEATVGMPKLNKFKSTEINDQDPTDSEIEILPEPSSSPEPSDPITPIKRMILPKPGFIIKTKLTTTDQRKVFINVFYDPEVQDPELTLLQTPDGYSFPEMDSTSLREDGNQSTISSISGNSDFTSVVPKRSQKRNDSYTIASSRGGFSALGSLETPSVRVIPHIFLCTMRQEVPDKEGRNAWLVSVVVSSVYFTGKIRSVTDGVSVGKIIQVLNMAFNWSMCDTSYTLPKVKAGFKCGPDGHDWAPPEAEYVANEFVVEQQSPLTQEAAHNLRALQKRRVPLPELIKEAAQCSPHLQVTMEPVKSGKLQPPMMEVHSEQHIDMSLLKGLKITSVSVPGILVGWQIVVLLEQRDIAAVAVVTATRKNLRRQSEFKLSTVDHGECWVKLKRGPSKPGFEFILIRKILLTASAEDRPISGLKI